MPKYRFYEFFAGGGMVRLGLGEDWECVFANDFSPRKARAYRANFAPAEEFVESDVFDLGVDDLPPGADMAWASFPCQDLSLAGNGAGMLPESRSGSFWGFWKLMKELADKGDAPPLIVLENVVGTITSRKGHDFEALLSALTDAGYRVGPLTIDAVDFVPQSRPRLFIVGVHRDVGIPDLLVQPRPDQKWHSSALWRAFLSQSPEIREQWIWWNLPYPPPRAKNLIDVLEDEPSGVEWHSPQQTNRLTELMNSRHLAKVQAARKAGKRTVGTVYRRIRSSGGEKAQRAEIRLDNVSGCLRTGSGGSSKQFIMLISDDETRSRLLSTREAARLMGVPDSYVLPENYSEAYHLMGDGVVVPVVSWVTHNILNPILDASTSYLEPVRASAPRQVRLLESKASQPST